MVININILVKFSSQYMVCEIIVEIVVTTFKSDYK